MTSSLAHGTAGSYNRDIAAFMRLEAAGERHLPVPAVATSIALNVLVADSSRMQARLLAAALRRHPELHLSSCQMNAASILQSVAVHHPQLALLSFSAPANFADEMGTLRRFHLNHPGIAKIILADSSNREMIIQGFRSGARGVVSVTDCDLRVLWKCILRVSAGQIWLNTEQLNWLIELISETPSLRVLNAAGHSLLTPREEQVVALVAEGLSNRQIAIELNLSEHTIKKYLFRIFEKLGISSRVELVLYAFHHGQPRTAEWLLPAAGLPG
ncbi:MAG TPA: response regulator transcription factor [Candidatus Sulfotelmatobacter sp.]